MSDKATKLVKDLVLLYIKQNYHEYLKKNKIEKIEEKKIKSVITKLYTERKEHLKEFLKSSLKAISESRGEEYIGDLFINNLCNEMYNDDQLCINRLVLEITNYQKNL